MADFLADSPLLELRSKEIAGALARLGVAELERKQAIRVAFEWVRDAIAHSMDVGGVELACSARSVLERGHGLCFAKSHLLVAMLRAQGVPAGFGYQRLRTDGTRSGFGLHGFVKVYDEERAAFFSLDPRGNNARVCTIYDELTPSLAFVPDGAQGEQTFEKVWAVPLENVVRFLESGRSLPVALSELPDGVEFG